MCRSILSNSKPKVTQNIMNRVEDDKLVLFRGHQFFVMEAYAAELWHMCDGTHTIEELIDFVVVKYGVSTERATIEITKFVNRLIEQKLAIL